MAALLNSALAYKDLLDIEYKIILGRKGKLTKFTIGFSKENFYHLVGLHKLNDIDFPTENKGMIFNLILDNQITDKFISKSRRFNSILTERIKPFINIVEIMDNNNLIFKYNKGAYNWAQMKCKFVLENKEHDIPIYIFIDKDKNEGQMFCRSFFIKGSIDFTARNTNMVLLYKEKISKTTGERIIQLDKLSKSK